MVAIHKDIHEFRARSPWGARSIAEIDGASVRLHWADRPYVWHVNDGAEVFVVLDGAVEMKYRQQGIEKSVRLGVADMFVAGAGDVHVAHPLGQARILVIERAGSV